MGVLTGPEAHQPRSIPSLAARWHIDSLWLTCCVVAAVLLAVTSFLPLWGMTLKAPQYPAGLHVTAYGSRMEGDIAEVNDLNHYIGARPIDPEEIHELDLFPFALGGLIAALLVGAVIAHGRLLRGLLIAAVWAFPVGLLVDLQWWLYQFGHNLDPDAPMRALVSGGFTPKVLGATQVANFYSITAVETGFWLMVAAALLVSAGPQSIRFVRDSWNNTSTRAGGAGKPIAAAVLLLALMSLAGPAHASASASASIMDMIASAAPGDTITVPPGTYHEQVVVDKPLILTGVESPVIDGGGRGDVVTIVAEGVILRGFMIQGSARDVSNEPAGIRVTGNRATIEHNRLRNVLYGIALSDSNGHTVRNNTISSMPEFSAERRGHALYLWQTDGNLIEGNTIDLVKDGIFLGFAARNRIERNRVTHARYGIHYMYANDNMFIDNVFRNNVAGGAIMFSRNITLRGNEFSGNRSAASGYGLLFKDVDNLEMVDNLIYHNRLGITMEGAPHEPDAFVAVTHNLIGFNQVGLELSTTTGATFTGNSFVGNLEQVTTTGGNLEHHNTWAVADRGNYWDDYQGYDANGNGVGDIPFQYAGAYNDLIQRSEALRAYAFTPARSALELAARWFPAFRPDPLVVDRAPLMSPTMSLPSGVRAGHWVAGYVVVALLAAVPLLVFRMVGRTQGSKWQRSSPSPV